MDWKRKTHWFMENGSARMLSMSQKSDIKGKSMYFHWKLHKKCQTFFMDKIIIPLSCFDQQLTSNQSFGKLQLQFQYSMQCRN